jgi:class 3 adenylate cyclase/tetratricopeptide (TPR) repeat protein
LSTRSELVQAVAAFVPTYVVRGIVSGRPPKPGDVYISEGAALFADVVGFTSMAERLARIMRGQAHQAEARGAEELNRIINQTFSAMITPIPKYGGVVTRFSGDALTAYFERLPDCSPSDVVISTVACAQAMQQAIASLTQVQVEGEIFPIGVKIGVGYGPGIFLTVGDEKNIMESVLAGRALEDAAAAQAYTAGGQNLREFPGSTTYACAPSVPTPQVQAGAGKTGSRAVVLAPSAWPLLPDDLLASGDRMKHRDKSATHPEYRVVSPLEHDMALLPPCGSPLAGLDEAMQEHLLHDLAPYLPPSIYDRVLLAQGDLPGDYRRVTNLFVFFNGLNFDDPDIGDKTQAYYRWAYAIVDRYGGRLIHVLVDDKGTGLHILFGAPDKHADDPIRGLRCALALQRDPSRSSFITRQRIGIASGIVFAATIGSPTRREYTVIGDEINLSARLTAACKPMEVLVDTYTQDRTARQFEFEALSPMQVKGKAQPVVAYRLLAERPSETGLVARYLSSRWRIVGRDAEVAALRYTADDALGKRGRVIALEGRAGVGKTRLVEEVVRHWVAHGGDGFVGQAVSHGFNSPYHLWASFWHAFFGFSEGDSTERRWQKVAAVIADEAPELASWIGVLAPVLGLPFAEASPTSVAPASTTLETPKASPFSLDAADRRRKLFEVTLNLLKARARRQPLLVLFEDLHWADRPSLELIDYVSEHISEVPLLLCLCFRPREDMELEVLSSMHCTWRVLDELQPEQSAELVRAILGEVDLPSILARDIYDKTQGNPLFVEEIVNSLIASGTLVPENGRYRLSGDPSAITIPDTLQDLLMARIDRLEAPSRDLVQVASVIDRRFPYTILRGIYPYPMSDLEMQERLNELIRPEDLTRLERPEPDLVYLFKHALTREVAYASLPFARRRELHRQVGEFMEAAYIDHLEEYYSTLAYHFDQSMQWERAFVCALLAGIQAQEVYANEEALRYYQQMEDYLTHLRIEIYWASALRMYLKRNILHRLNGDYELAEADLTRALELARTYHDTRAEAEAYCLLADLRYYEMRNEESLAAARQAYVIASTHNYLAELNTALVQLGIACQMVGDVELSMEYLQQAHDLAEQRGDRLTVGRALNTMAVAWWLYQGELDKALDGFQHVLEIRRAAGAKDREAECLANIANVQFRRGEFEAALETSEAALRVGRAAGWQYGLSYVQLDQADVYCYLGDYKTGQGLIEEAKRNLVPGDDLGQAYVQLWLGRNVHFDLGRDDLTTPMLETSLRFMRNYDHYEEMIRALTALGASYWRQGQLAQARDCLDEAHELSLTQHFPWQRSEICYRLGLVALAERRLDEAPHKWDEATSWAQRAQAAAAEGSNPDWLGPVHLLLAQVAHQRGAPVSHVASLYQQAISLAETRCRAVERAWTLREAGRYLSAHSHHVGRGQALVITRQAEEWLAARGIAG